MILLRLIFVLTCFYSVGLNGDSVVVASSPETIAEFPPPE